MRVHFDNVAPQGTGPGTFANRLARALFESGHEVLFESAAADVSLVFIEPSGAPLANKVVQRLDGIWSSPVHFEKRNASIKRLYESADAVIHQSTFDRRFIEHVWGKSKANSVVINNGIRAQPVKSFKHTGLERLRRDHELVFVSSAHWHPQKRLLANTEMFMHLRKITSKRCCFLVMGSNPDHVVADKDIFYAGSLPEDVFLEAYSMADWMIHLSWRDHCPNTVVEALSQGTPVICTEDSGTPELTKGYGVTLKELVPNNLQPFDYDKPPEIDVEQVEGFMKPSIDQVPDVSMESCLKQYLQVFEGCLSR